MGVTARIKRLMEDQNMNALQLAEKSKIPKSTIYAMLKRDNSDISYTTAVKLANALSCSESDILGFSDEVNGRYEEIKRRISSLKDEINKLKMSNDYVEYEVLDDCGEIITIKEDLHEMEISWLEGEIYSLTENLHKLLKDAGISVNPSKYAPIIKPYSQLNELGKIEAIKRVEELTFIEKYTKED